MVERYHVAFVVLGLAIFGAVVLPRLLSDRPLSLPIIYVVGGYLLFALPPGVAPPDMVENSELVELLAELVVIIALMGAGLKIDRPFSWRGWSPTWRLLGVTMVLTIVGTVLLGRLVMGLHIATAVLLGAVIAPTDPVLASDIEAGEPLAEMEEEEMVADRSYTVVRGDTLWDISGSTLGYNDPYQWPLIYRANQNRIDDADLIYPGQTLTIEAEPSRSAVNAAIEHAKTRGAWELGPIEESDKAYLANN
jgi:LysM repeat protein